jgi:hypothetical protein
MHIVRFVAKVYKKIISEPGYLLPARDQINNRPGTHKDAGPDLKLLTMRVSCVIMPGN